MKGNKNKKKGEANNMTSYYYEKAKMMIEKMPPQLWNTIMLEGNFKEWIDKKTGYQCRIVRPYTLGNWCGYVQVPTSHSYFGKPYDDISYDDVDIHGGLTYSDKDGFFGFDCAHGWDLKPDLDYGHEFLHKINSHYWTKEEVIEETEKLAGQLKKLEEKEK